DSFTVTTADGTSQVVTVTINGTDDATVIGGVATATVTETNAALSTGGQLTSSDPDSSAAFNAQAGVAGSNGYGSFSVDASGAWTYTTGSALNNLAAGQTVTDSFTVTTADGTSQVVTVTITGTNDDAVISGTAAGAVVEAGTAGPGTPSATGTLNATDVDGPATFTAVASATASAGGYGTYTMTAGGTWTYTLNNANAAVQALNDGDTLADSFTITAADGTQQVVTITIAGANDATVIAGTATGTVVEAGAAGPGTPDATGTLTATDPGGAVAFNATTAVSASGYGTYTVTAGGAWTFTLDNTNAAVQGLGAGQSLTDSFTVTTTDGTSQVVMVTINGSDDAPAAAIASATFTAAEQTALSLVGGGLAISDVDGPSVTATLSVGDGVLNVASGTTGALVAGSGTGTVTITGTQAQINALLAGNNGATVEYFNADDTPVASTTLTLTASDGTSTVSDTATINITPEAPSATIATPSFMAGEQSSLSLVGGGLSVSDVDGPAVTATLTVGEGILSVAAGTTGASVSGSGTGTVTLTGTQAQINALLAGGGGATVAYFNGSDTPSASTTLTLTASDGTLSASDTATITITAVNDAPVLAMPMLDQTATPGAPFTFTVPLGTFTDVDSALTLSATLAGGAPLPAWLGFDPLTRTFAGTPPAGFGPMAVQVTASDGTSVVAGDFRIVAPPAPPAPAVTAPTNVPVVSSSDGGNSSSQVPGSQQSSSSGTTPAGIGLGDLPPLSQPVDVYVAPSSINPNQTGGGIGALPDLNALPATGAGPSDALGFPVVRMPMGEALQVRDAGSFAVGHRLFVFHGIPTMQLTVDSVGSLRVPEDAFAHTDPSAVVQLEARLADGRPLPAWLKFEGLRGTFAGEPPEGLTGALEIEVVARDTEGREARTRFVLLVEDLKIEEIRGLQQAETPDLLLGLDVDAKEKEKQRLEAAKRAAEGKKPLPGATDVKVVPASSFSDQVRAAKASRDPLLDKIVPPAGDRPTPPRR
ncbi:MAG TPA: VCBS domain-containing protein, partial [Burkholderiales bacterium]|nr:VCBS domain-containing protein [Burkholderiales bacterium]